MNDNISKRKIDHINTIVSNDLIDRSKKCNYFENIKLTHRAIPEISLNEVDTSTFFLGKKLSFPLIISSMTGGADHKLLVKINCNLAKAANYTQVAMAVGSQRSMVENYNSRKSFDIRPIAQQIPLLSNIGAVQLNYGISLEHIVDIIDYIKADAIYFHFNPLQEVIQKEGNVNFSNLIRKIVKISEKIKIPVIIKEVGSGLSCEDVSLGIKSGISYFDISGAGGTSWSMTEALRYENINQEKKARLGMLFKDWGIPTPIALKNLKEYVAKAKFIASGGIRNGIDMVKSIILGASLCGVANPFLKAATVSEEEVILKIEQLRAEFQLAMFLLGARTLKDISNKESLILNYEMI